MRRENRRNKKEEGINGKNLLYITGTILALSIIAFVVSFFVYGNKLNKEQQIAKNNEKLNSLGTLEAVTETSTSYGKNVNEMKKQNSEVESKKIAINLNKIEEKKNDEVKKQDKVENKKVEVKDEKVKKEEIKDNKENKTQANKIKEEIKDPEFIRPVEGDIIKEFANNKLVYSNTLDVWTTHLGVDIKAEKTAVVKAAANGKVVSIKNDPRYGLTVIIEHVNGYKTVYANLLSAEFVVEGEDVKQGDSIGTVGNTAAFEITDEPHLHFELLKDNEELDPELFLN